MENGDSPKEKKTAIFSVFEKGHTENPENYGCVILLNIIEKIFTKIMLTKLTKYINENNSYFRFRVGYVAIILDGRLFSSTRSRV